MSRSVPPPSQGPSRTADVSVVIAGLRDGTVRRTVASVTESGRHAGLETEIVVVWQGASEPPAIAGARVVAIHNVNLSYARNRGAASAAAPFVGYVDDDEVVDEGWVAAIAGALADADGAFGPVDTLDDEGRPHCQTGHGVDRVYQGYVPPWLVGTGGCMAFRKEALEAVAGFDLRFGAGSIGMSGEETELIWRLLSTGRRIRWAPDMIVYHPTKTDDEILASRYPYGVGAGRVLRRARSPRLIVNYTHALLHAAARAVRLRSPQDRREASDFRRGLVTGMTHRHTWMAPALASQPVPAAIEAALAGRAAAPLPVPWRDHPHFVWRCGDAVLHAYVHPSETQLGAPAARDRIRSLPGATRVPAVLAHAESQDCLWVLEEHVDGSRPDARRPELWWPDAVRWILPYAGADGPPMGGTPGWPSFAAGLPATARAGHRRAIEAALERVAGLPSGPSHGEMQAKNLRVTAGGTSAFGWEFCSTQAIRGLDLILLATTHAGATPDARVVRRLAEGRDPGFGDVLGPLRELGLEDQALRDTLLVVLAKWAADERRRHGAVAAGDRTAHYGRMLDEVAPLLV